MTVLSGEGRGERAVSGLTSHFRTEGARPTLDSETLLAILQTRRTGGPERDIVLIAEDPAMALLAPLPLGARLVGVVARNPLLARASVVAGIAVLSETTDDLEALPEGAYAIVDPIRGRALIDPGPKEIALYQSHLTPRTLLGSAHDPARTLSGVTVPVWAIVSTPGEMEDALTGGADGLLWDGFCDADWLRSVARELGGGDLAIRASFDALAPAAWLALAHHCRLWLCLAPEETRIEQTLAELEDAEVFLEAEGKPSGTIRLCAIVESQPPVYLNLWDGALSLSGWTPDDLLSTPPVLLRATLDELPDAVASGPLAVLVNPDDVRVAKDAIRELP